MSACTPAPREAYSPMDPVEMMQMCAVTTAEDIARRLFGWPRLRGFQRRSVEAWAADRNCFVRSGTGSGKSGCFVLPALVAREWHHRLQQRGPLPMAVVISPLVALMRDQARRLQSHGVPAAICSPQVGGEGHQQAVWSQGVAGQLVVCYISPELVYRMARNGRLGELRNVSLIAIDEAHCVSEWGHDFRPEYGKLHEVIGALASSGRCGKAPPVFALTATCGPEAHHDVMQCLGLTSARTDQVLGTMNRPNLHISVEELPDTRKMMDRLLQLFEGAGPDPAEVSARQAAAIDASSPGCRSPTIVYCRYKHDCEEICSMFGAAGVKAAMYHAGLGQNVQVESQEAFNENRVQAVVATIAFGMGIDKPDVRRVIHFGMPKSMEDFAQQSGRAGRDGAPGRCIILFTVSDRSKMEKAMLSGSMPLPQLHRNVQLGQDAFHFCRDRRVCRRLRLLERLGETPMAREAGEAFAAALCGSQAPPSFGAPGHCTPSGPGGAACCSNCDVCCRPGRAAGRSMRRELQVLLGSLDALRGEPTGRTGLVEAIPRAARARFGIDKAGWLRILDEAVHVGHIQLKIVPRTATNWPFVCPTLTEQGRAELARGAAAAPEFLVDMGGSVVDRCPHGSSAAAGGDGQASGQLVAAHPPSEGWRREAAAMHAAACREAAARRRLPPVPPFEGAAPLPLPPVDDDLASVPTAPEAPAAAPLPDASPPSAPVPDSLASVPSAPVPLLDARPFAAPEAPRALGRADAALLDALLVEPTATPVPLVNSGASVAEAPLEFGLSGVALPEAPDWRCLASVPEAPGLAAPPLQDVQQASVPEAPRAPGSPVVMVHDSLASTVLEDSPGMTARQLVGVDPAPVLEALAVPSALPRAGATARGAPRTIAASPLDVDDLASPGPAARPVQPVAAAHEGARHARALPASHPPTAAAGAPGRSARHQRPAAVAHEDEPPARRPRCAEAGGQADARAPARGFDLVKAELAAEVAGIADVRVAQAALEAIRMLVACVPPNPAGGPIGQGPPAGGSDCAAAPHPEALLEAPGTRTGSDIAADSGSVVAGRPVAAAGRCSDAGPSVADGWPAGAGRPAAVHCALGPTASCGGPGGERLRAEGGRGRSRGRGRGMASRAAAVAAARVGPAAAAGARRLGPAAAAGAAAAAQETRCSGSSADGLPRSSGAASSRAQHCAASAAGEGRSSGAASSAAQRGAASASGEGEHLERGRKKARRRRRYTAAEKAAAGPIVAEMMELADYNSNQVGGAGEFKRKLRALREKVGEELRHELDEVQRAFNQKTLYVHGLKLDEIIRKLQATPRASRRGGPASQPLPPANVAAAGA